MEYHEADLEVLVEKPLERSYNEGLDLSEIARRERARVFVAYNLRFLSVFERIREFVAENRTSIRVVNIVAGQDLREWRPERVLESTYGAERAQGGGVDLYLSHEVDYALWVFGGESARQYMCRDKISNLPINSPDFFRVGLKYEGFYVDILLDYIRRPKERYVQVICDGGTSLVYDFVSDRLKLNGAEESKGNSLDDSYKDMLGEFLAPPKDRDRLCTIEEGLRVLRLLEA